MYGYKAAAVGLRFLVDLLLLIGANRFCGDWAGLFRCVLGALVGALYTTLCLIPGFHFLGNLFWSAISMLISCMVSYGIDKTAFRTGALYLLLHLAVNGILASSARSAIGAVFAGIGVLLLGSLGFFHGGARRYIPVELKYGGKELKLTALMDTGNTLYDPVTGQSVLVMGADAAQALTGLTLEQLRCPVEAMGSLPGLRLIPYKSVGTDSGLMLGLRIGRVKIGSRYCSRVIAMAPQQLSANYQLLVGGVS